MATPSHFKKTEAPGRALRRIYRAHLKSARGQLRQSHRAAAIHRVRKEIKKSRAILRLARAQIGPLCYRKAGKPLRRAARRLARLRDARVRLGAFEKLTGPSAGQFPKTREALQKFYQQEMRRFQKLHSSKAAKKILRKARRRLDRMKDPIAGWPAIAPGLLQTYERGRVQLHRVCREPSSEHFHELRKQVKNLAYYLQLVCPRWPPAIRKWIDELEFLGELIGEEHDLFLLQQFALARDFADEAGVLNHLIIARLQTLRDRALKSSAPVFVEPVAAIAPRLENAWHRWRED